MTTLKEQIQDVDEMAFVPDDLNADEAAAWMAGWDTAIAAVLQILKANLEK